MKSNFEQLSVIRNNFLKIILSENLENLNFVPDGFKNSIAWNFIHAIQSMQGLCYVRAGVTPRIPLKPEFAKGADGSLAIAQDTIDYYVEKALETVKWLEQDYNAGLFKKYDEYSSSFGYDITNMEEAITFSNIHEGLHLGYIMAQRKLLL